MTSRQYLKSDNNTADPAVLEPGVIFYKYFFAAFAFLFRQVLPVSLPSFSSLYQNNYIYIKENQGMITVRPSFPAGSIFTIRCISSMRDIYPRLAQVVDLNFSIYPWDKEFYGSVTALQTAFFFPGIFPNNVLRIRYENEFQTAARLLRPNRIQFSERLQEYNFGRAQLCIMRLQSALVISRLKYWQPSVSKEDTCRIILRLCKGNKQLLS